MQIDSYKRWLSEMIINAKNEDELRVIKYIDETLDHNLHASIEYSLSLLNNLATREDLQKFRKQVLYHMRRCYKIPSVKNPTRVKATDI